MKNLLSLALVISFLLFSACSEDSSTNSTDDNNNNGNNKPKHSLSFDYSGSQEGSFSSSAAALIADLSDNNLSFTGTAYSGNMGCQIGIFDINDSGSQNLSLSGDSYIILNFGSSTYSSYSGEINITVNNLDRIEGHFNAELSEITGGGTITVKNGEFIYYK